MKNEILGHDADGAPLREGDEVEFAEAPHPSHGVPHGTITTVVGPCRHGVLLGMMVHGHAAGAAPEKLRKVTDQ